MPLVRIELVKGRTPEERTAIGKAVHKAMMETIDVPEDDVFQIISEHERSDMRIGEFQGVVRDDGVVLVQMLMKSGRTFEQKLNLHRRITENLVESAGVTPNNVVIALHENQPEEWSFGHGRAHLVEQPVAEQA